MERARRASDNVKAGPESYSHVGEPLHSHVGESHKGWCNVGEGQESFRQRWRTSQELVESLKRPQGLVRALEHPVETRASEGTRASCGDKG